MKRFFYTFATLFLLNTAAQAQVKVGAPGAADPSAVLEVTGGPDSNKGLLLPRLSTLQRDAITLPATGLVIYNTTDNQLQVNMGTPQVPIWTIPASNDSWGTSGNTGTNPASNFLGTSDGQPLVIRTTNTERLRIDEGGNVGIGTATPGGRLTIAGAFTPYAGMTVQNTGSENATIMTVTPGFDMGVAAASITTFDMNGTGSFTFGDNVIGAVGMQLGLPDRRWAAVSAENVDISGNGRIGGSVPSNTVTSITGRDATGNIGNVTLGTGLTFADGTLSSTATGSGVNIYNSDGALTGARTVTLAENPLTFNGTGIINLNSGAVGIGTATPSGRLTVAGPFTPYAGITAQNTSAENATTISITPGFDMATPAPNITTFDMNGIGAFTFGDNVIPSGGVQLGLPDRRWAAVNADFMDVNNLGRIGGSAASNTLTSITGRDATGVIGNITLGAGLSFENGTISATATGSGDNLYNSDGALTGPRTVTLAENPLTFNGTGIINLNSGAVGIGTATPGGRLTVAGAFTPYAGVTVQNTNTEIATTMTVTPGYDMSAAAANITTFDMDGTGSFTFGDNVIGAIGMQLGLPGRRWAAVHADNVEVAGDVNAGNTVRAAGVVLTSDARLKTSVTNITSGLKSVMALRPVSYNKKKSIGGKGYGRHELGFIAQEVAKVLPNIVTEGTDNDKILGISYTELIPVLTRAIQEQQTLIQEQSEQIAQLKAQQLVTAQLVEKVMQIEQKMVLKETKGNSKVAGK